jgi:hypothetical protein
MTAKRIVTITKNNQLMLFRKIVAVYSEIHTKDLNTIRKKSAGCF